MRGIIYRNNNFRYLENIERFFDFKIDEKSVLIKNRFCPLNISDFL